MWNAEKSVQYLNANASGVSSHRCAEFTRKAIEAGGVSLQRCSSAKSYGDSLKKAGFKDIGTASGKYSLGDIVIIDAIPGQPHGHMAMYNGTIWVSDFRQNGLYPGPRYRTQKAPFKIYRYE